MFLQAGALALFVDLSYDWQRYESGYEQIDLKERLLYGPHSKPILPKISKNGNIIDPGGRWNVIPLEGGVRFRTVSTPRFDGYGRLKGSDPTSWVTTMRKQRPIFDQVISETEPEIQAMVQSAEIFT